ncbi:MAG TPA: 50S ribosomal protein L10 [Magnetospirillaceae bacterium]|nr:50S ribosomal protein L10 [Magnetospirillaceae bacterium]
MAMRAEKLQPSKTEAIGDLGKKIAESKDFLFADYRGLTVEQITNLRKQLRAKNVYFHIVKNNFARIAFGAGGYPDVSSLLKGPTAIAFARADSNEAAKILVDSSKESPVRLKGGLVDRRFYDKAMIEAFSRLPGKSQLIAMLMSAMKGPVTGLVHVLNAVPSKLVRTLKAVEEAKGQSKKLD